MCFTIRNLIHGRVSESANQSSRNRITFIIIIITLGCHKHRNYTQQYFGTMFVVKTKFLLTQLLDLYDAHSTTMS